MHVFLMITASIWSQWENVLKVSIQRVQEILLKRQHPNKQNYEPLNFKAQLIPNNFEAPYKLVGTKTLHKSKQKQKQWTNNYEQQSKS